MNNNGTKKVYIIYVIAIMVLVIFGIIVVYNRQLINENKELQQENDDLRASTAEILPCPFCGSYNVALKDVSHAMSNHKDGEVVCNNCYASSGYIKTNNPLEYYTFTEALEVWNSIPRDVDSDEKDEEYVDSSTSSKNSEIISVPPLGKVINKEDIDYGGYFFSNGPSVYSDFFIYEYDDDDRYLHYTVNVNNKEENKYVKLTDDFKFYAKFCDYYTEDKYDCNETYMEFKTDDAINLLNHIPHPEYGGRFTHIIFVSDKNDCLKYIMLVWYINERAS